MSSLQHFISQFLKNKGQHVFFSLLIAKFCAFAGSLFIIRILPESEFGTVSIVASIFAVFLPFSGLGSQQSLLRYGSISADEVQKKALAAYLFRRGFYAQVVLSIIFMSVSFFYVSSYSDIFLVFLFFSVRLLGFYFFNHLQSVLRIFGDNKKFAFVMNVVNVSGMILLLVFSYFFGIVGYLSAVAITPFIAFFWIRKEYFISALAPLAFNSRELQNYGLHAAGTALISDALFSADVLMLGFLMNESAVANYKVAILIPANITFLALTFMQSDFPTLAQHYQDKTFLKSYVFNYYKIFIPISILIFVLGYLFRLEILHLFFGDRYMDNTLSFSILLASFCFNMLLRNLYGNLLSAVGLMKVNTLISAVTLLLLLGLGFISVQMWDVVGMAVALSLSMLTGGLLLFISFYRYWKNLK